MGRELGLAALTQGSMEALVEQPGTFQENRGVLLLQMAETVQWSDRQLLKEENESTLEEMSLLIYRVRVKNYLPVLTEEGGESNLGRKVRQPSGRECRDRKSGHCGREVRQTVEKDLKDTCFGEYRSQQSMGLHSNSTCLTLITGLPHGITSMLLRKNKAPCMI